MQTIDQKLAFLGSPSEQNKFNKGQFFALTALKQQLIAIEDEMLTSWEQDVMMEERNHQEQEEIALDDLADGMEEFRAIQDDINEGRF
jgi:hypothetical protein